MVMSLGDPFGCILSSFPHLLFLVPDSTSSLAARAMCRHASVSQKDAAPPAATPSSHPPSTAFQRVQTVLSRIPAEVGGIALNLAGLGSWISVACELYPALTPALGPGSAIVVLLASVIQLGVLLQALLANKHLRGELQKPKQCGSYGGLLMKLKGDHRQLDKLTLDARVYLLVRKFV